MVWDGLGCDGGWSAVGVSRRAGCASLGASSLPPPCLSALGPTELSAQMCLSRGRSEVPGTQGWMPLSDHDAAAPHTGSLPCNNAQPREGERASLRHGSRDGPGREKGGRHISVFSWAWPTPESENNQWKKQGVHAERAPSAVIGLSPRRVQQHRPAATKGMDDAIGPLCNHCRRSPRCDLSPPWPEKGCVAFN